MCVGEERYSVQTSRGQRSKAADRSVINVPNLSSPVCFRNTDPSPFCHVPHSSSSLPCPAAVATASVLPTRLARKRLGRRDNCDSIAARVVLKPDVQHVGHHEGCRNPGGKRPTLQCEVGRAEVAGGIRLLCALDAVFSGGRLAAFCPFQYCLVFS